MTRAAACSCEGRETAAWPHAARWSAGRGGCSAASGGSRSSSSRSSPSRWLQPWAASRSSTTRALRTTRDSVRPRHVAPVRRHGPTQARGGGRRRRATVRHDRRHRAPLLRRAGRRRAGVLPGARPGRRVRRRGARPPPGWLPHGTTRPPSRTAWPSSCGSTSARPWRSTAGAGRSSASSRTATSSATSSRSSPPRPRRRSTSPSWSTRATRRSVVHLDSQGERGPPALVQIAVRTMRARRHPRDGLRRHGLPAARVAGRGRRLRGRRAAQAPAARHARRRRCHGEAAPVRSGGQRCHRRSDRRTCRHHRRARSVERGRPNARGRGRPPHRPARPPVGSARVVVLPCSRRRDGCRLVAGPSRSPPPGRARALGATAETPPGPPRGRRGCGADCGRPRAARALRPREDGAHRRRDRGDDPRLPLARPARRSDWSPAWPGACRSRRAWRCETSFATRPAPEPRSPPSRWPSASRQRSSSSPRRRRRSETPSRPTSRTDRSAFTSARTDAEATPVDALAQMEPWTPASTARRATRRRDRGSATQGRPAGRRLDVVDNTQVLRHGRSHARERAGGQLHASRALRRHAGGARVPRHRSRHDRSRARTSSSTPAFRRTGSSFPSMRPASDFAVTNVQRVETPERLFGSGDARGTRRRRSSPSTGFDATAGADPVDLARRVESAPDERADRDARERRRGRRLHDRSASTRKPRSPRRWRSPRAPARCSRSPSSR